MPSDASSNTRLSRLGERLRSFRLLSPLQLRTMIGIWAYVLVLSLLDRVAAYGPAHQERAKALATLLGVLAAVPILAIIATLGRYLARETDEYIRMLVVKGLLWAAAVAVVAATMQGALAQWSAGWTLSPVETAMMNVDIFVAVGMIFLAAQFRKNR